VPRRLERRHPVCRKIKARSVNLRQCVSSSNPFPDYIFDVRAGRACARPSSDVWDVFFALNAALEETITMSELPASAADKAVPLRPVTGTFLSRRDVLAAAAAGGAVLAAGPAHAATFGNPDEPPEGAINSTPGALSDPGAAESEAAVAIPQCGQSAADGCRRHAAVLGLLQQRPQTHPERRLGA
jgi:hypothetical protein